MVPEEKGIVSKDSESKSFLVNKSKSILLNDSSAIKSLKDNTLVLPSVLGVFKEL